MAGFELGSSGIGSDRTANCATTTTHVLLLLHNVGTQYAKTLTYLLDDSKIQGWCCQYNVAVNSKTVLSKKSLERSIENGEKYGRSVKSDVNTKQFGRPQ